MIQLSRKEDCVGCGACGDVCAHRAITFPVDIEGFWYPEVDKDKCIQCGLCEKVCPVIHVEELKAHQSEQPIVYAAYDRDLSVRLASTSGGLFSALARRMYQKGGYVGGAVYTSDFYVQHIVSDLPEDLLRIRGSKHFQSEMEGMYKEVRSLLNRGEEVLFCAAPCQIAGLRLFLRKEFKNLITVDFLCLGINSPKIFHRHLEALERKYGSPVVKIQAKNKDKGWRSLAYKIEFANRKVYLKPGNEDAFTRGFIQLHCNCRPACYECRFKGFPRISDISLGDFWGIEKVDRMMDDNRGTSVVLINSDKGAEYFETVKEFIVSKEKKIADVLPGNPALIQSVVRPKIDRSVFYQDVDSLPFEQVIEKYFPRVGKCKKMRRSICFLIHSIGFNPLNWGKALSVNFFRRNTLRRSKRGGILPTPYTVLDIHKTAKINLSGAILLGYKRVRGSRTETSLLLEQNSRLNVNKDLITVYYGTDIQVFRNAELNFKGQVILNKNVQIICMERIDIGEGCMISRDVVIRDNDGGHQILTEGYKKTAPVSIGDHVWIGQGAMIMKGVTIGDGAIIGAGAWVITNVKPHAVVMGDPARMVQKNVEWIQ